MIDYGGPPAADEIEVTLFGPGFGEAIAIHLGDGAWFLVDSCIEPTSKNSASGVYLDYIGIKSEQVKAIVASHWHDDHIRGISELSEKYSDADFVISTVFNDKKSLAFLAAYNSKSSNGLSQGTKELFNVLDSHSNIYHASYKTLVFNETLNKLPVTVIALAPRPEAYSQSITRFAQYLPTSGKAINNAPDLKQNYESIVLHIDVGNDAILLGSDLEEHTNFGWTAVIVDKWSKTRKPSSLYKVAHHGSATGHCEQVWSILLEEDPIACLTPWVLAGNRIPTDAQQKIIKDKSKFAYIASAASRKPKMDSGMLKRLKDIGSNISLVDTGFGAVRHRKKIDANTWSVELFGAAQQL